MCLSLASDGGARNHRSVTAKGSAAEWAGMRDASLDEFLSGSDEEDGKPAGEREVEETDGEAGSAVPHSDTEPEAETEPEPEAETEAETGTESDTETEAGEETETGPEPDGPPPIAEVDPARSTFAWSPDGAACAECGASVEERWEAEAGLVCVECKEW